MSSFHSSFNDDDFENSATNYALSQNYDHDIDYNSTAQGCNALNAQDDDENEIQPGEVRKKRNKDPNEPVKPVSAYAAFFRDTQIAIKSQNPNASFDEISKIVASMWEALDTDHKNVYKKNAEIAKKEYVKAMTEYRANHLMTDDPTQEEIASNTKIFSPSKKQLPIASKPAVFTIPATADGVSNPLGSPTSSNNLMGSPSAGDSNDTSSFQKCIREGCANRAVVNPDWEDEYCSNECAVKHCRNVFNNWVLTNKDPPAEEITA